MIFGEYYGEIICSICLLRKILNQKEEKRKRERKERMREKVDEWKRKMEEIGEKRIEERQGEG